LIFVEETEKNIVKNAKLKSYKNNQYYGYLKDVSAYGAINNALRYQKK